VRGGLTRRTVIASSLLMLVIGAAFAVLLVALDGLRETTRLTTESQQVLTAANTLERLVVDLETGSRGYIITGDPRFLEPWDAARGAIPGQSRELVRLAAVHSQDVQAQRIARAVASYVREYSVPLVDAVQRKAISGRSAATTAEGKRRVDAIRAEFDRFTAAENELATERRENADSAERRALIAVVAGLAGSILLIALYAGDLVRSIVRPVVGIAALAGRLAGGDLVARAPQTGIGEIGKLQRAFNNMASSLAANRDELRLLADEQAALRRVATLVARGDSPRDVFAAVSEEVGRLLGADSTVLLRFEPDEAATVVAAHTAPGAEIEIGTRVALADENVAATVLRTAGSARVDDDGRTGGWQTRLGAPIVVAGRLWGVMIGSWRASETVPDGIDDRLAEFTGLVATAIANADSHAQLTASRARIVTAADDARRRIERDLHDGTQQRLVSLALELRGAEAIVPPGQEELKAQLARAATGLAAATEDLQQMSRGIHPAILSEGGLGPALKTLGRRSAVPVELDVRSERRLPGPVEVAAYYVVSEALANAAKHAHATVVHVDVSADDAQLELLIRDDGDGGADSGRGSGLIGLTDRVEALGGELVIASPPGSGTSLRVRIPIAGSPAP
jgi:signal transduction histidine kinase/CHASE3 domain sensor protein